MPKKLHKPETTPPSRDRRPFWVRQPGLFPSPEAVALGRKVLPYVKYLIEARREFANVSVEDDELEDQVVNVAAHYLQTQVWMELPSSESYHNEIVTLQRSVQALLDQLRATSQDALLELGLLTRRKIGIELREKTRPSPSTNVEQLLEDETDPPPIPDVKWLLGDDEQLVGDEPGPSPSTNVEQLLGEDEKPLGGETGPSPSTSVEQLLAQVLAVCQASTEAPNKTGDQGRPDLACAASHLANFWATLSGKRFGRYIARNKKIESPTYMGELAFDSPGAQFIRDLLPAFDSSVTPSQVETAIKSIPVKPKEDQHSPEDEEDNADLATHRD